MQGVEFTEILKISKSIYNQSQTYGKMVGSTSLEYENVLKVTGILTCRLSQERLWQV